MDIDYKQVINDCIAAAKPELGKGWKSFKPYAELEFKQFAESAQHLAKLKLDGVITDEELAERLTLQKTALKNVMLTIQGIGLVAAQNAINAVIDVVAKAIKASLKVALPF